MDGIINELYEGLGSEMLATLPKLVPYSIPSNILVRIICSADKDRTLDSSDDIA